MALIKDPDSISESLVADYRQVFAANLVAIIMYGSILTSDYKPGKSDVNIVVVLNDDSITAISKSSRIVQQLAKRRVSVPFFMSRQFITSALDVYPIEFLDIQSNYRVLFGEDVFAGLNIEKNDLRLQCERELRGLAIHLRTAYIVAGNSRKELSRLLAVSLKKLVPICKALLVLRNLDVPNNRGGILAAAEHEFAQGKTALVDVYNVVCCDSIKHTYADLFNDFAYTIDLLIQAIDTYPSERITV